MKVYLLLVLVLAVIAQEKHLIKLSENDQGKWVTEEEINRFTMGTETNFMDVTYTSDLEKGSVPESSKIVSDLRLKNIVHPMIAEVKEANLNKTILHLSSYFNRFYTTQDGEDAAKWIRKQYEDLIDGLSGDRKARLSVELFEHRWRQPSVIVRFRGKSASVRDQIVILGSHLDSTAGGASRRSPGADDDATGSSSVMEAFRVMIQDNSWDPDRTVEWHHYAAEEVGLLGSQAVAQRYKQDQKKIHGMLQMDMTGFTNAQNQNRVGVVTDFTDSGINTLLRKCIVEYGKLPFIDMRCGYACSDHASWTKAGYRSAFGFEVGSFSLANKAIHTDRDLITNLDMPRATKFVKFGIGLAVELAKE